MGRFLCLALAFFCASQVSQAGTLAVFAAASLTDCLKEIGTNFRAERNIQVEYNFAASSILARQIEEGAPADLFFSADEAKMDQLQQKGLIDPVTRRDQLSNTLVIIVPSDSRATVNGPADLRSAAFGRIALADPAAVPAGIYARDYLQKVHLWEALAPKVQPMANVRAALAVVESGDADAGFVYATDAAISKKARVAYAVPAAAGPKIVYPVAALKDASNPAAARAFLAFLASKSAGMTFVKYGFAWLTPAP
jgi:molybdate transport system substrate-binding protein